MKKRVKKKPSEGGQDNSVNVTDIMERIQQQLVFLEKKIDNLISQSAGKSSNREPGGNSFKRYDRPQRSADALQGNYRDRMLYKAVCAECNKECEVPFKPTGERPVYCKECFSKRKTGSSFAESRGKGPGEWISTRERHAAKYFGPWHSKPSDTKRSSFKKRKRG